MDLEAGLQVCEDLLSAELESLRRYNRVLEAGTDPLVSAVLSLIRDEQVRRVESLNEAIRRYREALEV